MIIKRGPHPEEIPLSEAELQRRKLWRAQDSRQKDYERGTKVEEMQQDLPLDLNIRGNADLPLYLQDIKHPPQAQKTSLFCPETLEQDPNCVYGGVRNRLYSHFSKTIVGQYRAAAKKIAEQHWLDANGCPETTVIKDPSKRLARRLDQKLYSKYYQKRPQLPKDYQEQAQQRDPSISEPLFHLLYLHDILSWNFDDIAFRLNSSPSQIEHWYWGARILNLLYQRMRKLSSVS